jgi:2-iminoacetate synthase
MMEEFEIDPNSLQRLGSLALEKADKGGGARRIERLAGGEKLRDEELIAVFLDREVATQTLLELSEELRATASPQIETFSPLYISNECDAECLMCGMRRFNEEMVRETADDSVVKRQLDILSQRGMQGVALLTGEYRHGSMRREMLARTASAARDALERGFTHVLINVGSIEDAEYPGLLDGLPLRGDGSIAPHVTMCTFQESYDPNVYRKFMGSAPQNPRADFHRRLLNFDRAAKAGMRSANPGILVGLNSDLAYEMLALLDHVRHLSGLGLKVYVSLPRLRKASGAEHKAGVGDDDFCRLVAVLAVGLPNAKIVISTRERPEIQRRLLPVIGVLTPGSPGVAPYTQNGARFDVEASQFEVADLRPFEEILGECIAAGAIIDGYQPAAYPAETS